MTWLSALFSRIAAKLLAILAAIGAGGVLLWSIRRDAAHDALAERDAADAKAMADAYRKAGEVRRDVAAADDEQLDQRMRRWER